MREFFGQILANGLKMLAKLLAWLREFLADAFRKHVFNSLKNRYRALSARLVNSAHDARNSAKRFLRSAVAAAPVETLVRRELVANEILDLARSIPASGDPNESQAAFEAIKQSARSRNRFRRCYALNMLGRLNSSDPEVAELAAEALASHDPFVRQMAAQMLSRTRNWSTPYAVTQLVEAIRRFPTSGAAHYAAIALYTAEVGKLGENRAVLERAASTPRSMAKREIDELLQRIDTEGTV